MRGRLIVLALVTVGPRSREGAPTANIKPMLGYPDPEGLR